MSKLLNYGGFGCIYYPHLTIPKCKLDDSNKSYISKLQVKDETAKNEIKISIKIKDIKNYLYFFSPIIKSCPVSLKNLDDELKKECPITNKYSNRSFILSYVNYIESTSFNDYFNKELKYENFFINMLNKYYYLVNSIQILDEHNIIHYDIKIDNILLDKKRDIPIIIDFGLSFDKKDILNNLKNIFYIFAPDYILWCPDIQIISYLVNNDSELNKNLITKELLNDIFKEYIVNIRFFNLFSINFTDKYILALKLYYSKFIGKKSDYIVNELLKFSSTWDMYSLSLIFLKILHRKYDSLSETDKSKFEENKLNIILLEIFLLNISPFTDKRLNFKKTKELLIKLKESIIDEKTLMKTISPYIQVKLSEYDFSLLKIIKKKLEFF